MPVKRMMLIVRQLAHSLKLKEALERSGLFLTSAFANPEDALAELARAPYDLILLDCTISGLDPESFVPQVRQIRPTIAIIAAPNHPLVRGLQTSLQLQAVIDLPIAARQLIPLIQGILIDPAPDAPPASNIAIHPLPPSPEPLSPEDEAEAQRREEQSSRLFERLAAAEPPMPPFEESVTVRDVVVGLSSTQPTRIFLSGQDGADGADSADDEETASTPPSRSSRQLLANHILQEALETASAPTPPQGFSLAKFIQRVQERLQEGQALIKPLPSWMDDSGRYVREPEFLPDLPSLEGPPSTYTASQTYARPSEDQPPPKADPAQQATDRIEPVRRSTPPPADLEAFAAEEAPPTSTKPIRPLKPRLQVEQEGKQAEERLPVLPAELSSTTLTPTRQDALLAEALTAALRADQARLEAEQAEQAQQQEEGSPAESESPPPQEAPPAPAPASPPALPAEVPAAQVDSVRYAQALSAQVALALTDLSLETVVEACLLVREGQIVGSSGQMPAALLEEVVPQALEPLEEGVAARMTPLELASGAFYMLYAIRTVDAFTLVLLFAGQQTVSTIRHHARLLHEVLASVPPPLVSPPPTPVLPAEAESADEQAAQQAESTIPPVDVAPLAFVWLLHPDQRPLEDAEMQAILRGLDVSLTDQGWIIHDLDVYQDAISLHASAPTQSAPAVHMRTLLSLSAQAVRLVNPARSADPLWDRSYWIVTPGRAIGMDELRDFIAFARP